MIITYSPCLPTTFGSSSPSFWVIRLSGRGRGLKGTGLNILGEKWRMSSMTCVHNSTIGHSPTFQGTLSTLKKNNDKIRRHVTQQTSLNPKPLNLPAKGGWMDQSQFEASKLRASRRPRPRSIFPTTGVPLTLLDIVLYCSMIYYTTL